MHNHLNLWTNAFAYSAISKLIFWIEICL